MRKIKVCIETGYVGGTYEDEFEVEDNTPDSEIDEMACELVNEYITVSWREDREV